MSSSAAHTPEHSQNPYQAYPQHSGPYPSQSAYPGAAGSNNARGVAGSDQYSSVGPSVVGNYSPNLSPHFNGTTGMLSILALVSLYEATQRVIFYSNSGTPWDATDDYFPRAALLVAGLWEAIYSLATLFIALWAVLFDWHSVILTTLVLGSQFVGWYTVVVFGLAQPALAAHHYNAVAYQGVNHGQDQNDFSASQTRASYVFGWLFPLFSLNTALLAAVIFFTIQLLQIQSNNVNELHSPHYYGRRLGFWSLLQMWYGVSTIIYAAIYLGKNWNNFEGNAVDYFYPNVTHWGSITLITGILMTIISALGLMAACCNNLRISNLYIASAWLTFLWVVGAHIMGQLGDINAGFNQAGYGLSELGLFFGVLLTTMFLAYKAATIETVHRGNYIAPNAGYAANRNVVV